MLLRKHCSREDAMRKATRNIASQAGHPSIADMVTQLRVDLCNMRKDLLDARCENVRLRRELTRLRSQKNVSSEFNIPSLRREVAFHCHPDRGGSTSLMSRLNTFFDHLAGAECSQTFSYTECQREAA